MTPKFSRWWVYYKGNCGVCFEDGPKAIANLSIVLHMIKFAIDEARSYQEQNTKLKIPRQAKDMLAGSKSKIDTFFKKKKC